MTIQISFWGGVQGAEVGTDRKRQRGSPAPQGDLEKIDVGSHTVQEAGAARES